MAQTVTREYLQNSVSVIMALNFDNKVAPHRIHHATESIHVTTEVAVYVFLTA